MDANLFYTDRLLELEQLQKKQISTRNQLAWSRLLLFAVAIAGIYFLHTKTIVVIIFSIVCLALFVQMLLKQLKINEAVKHTAFLIEIIMVQGLKPKHMRIVMISIFLEKHLYINFVIEQARLWASNYLVNGYYKLQQ
jgi:hypothetical protein